MNANCPDDKTQKTMTPSPLNRLCSLLSSFFVSKLRVRMHALFLSHGCCAAQWDNICGRHSVHHYTQEERKQQYLTLPKSIWNDINSQETGCSLTGKVVIPPLSDLSEFQTDLQSRSGLCSTEWWKYSKFSDLPKLGKVGIKDKSFQLHWTWPGQVPTG